jgi:prepilin-type N-terminal cleavage/methylation domain-containing protein
MYKNKFGFTIVEIILVVALFALLSSFVGLNALRVQTHNTVVSTVEAFVADMKAQQVRAIAGDSQGQATSQEWGIHFESDRYVLFRGSTYLSSDPGNFAVDIEAPLAISWTLPTQDLVFQKISGEVDNFVGGSDTITFTHAASGEARTISFNRYGVISIN